MKRKLAFLFALIGWFAIILQYVLMVKFTAVPLPETTMRFFSYFTILTNIIVAVYFTRIAFSKNETQTGLTKPGTLTAITVYISMVCAVYQLVLRGTWNPQGMHRLVDELLHSVIPLLVIIFWCMYETAKPIRYTQLFSWAIYPLMYLIYILLRGKPSGFYPYPFVDVTQLGMQKVLINSGVLVLVFLVVAALFIFIGKAFFKR